MPGERQHNEELVMAVGAVNAILYGSPHVNAEATLEVLAEQLPEVRNNLLEDALDVLHEASLVRLRPGGRISLNPYGKTAHEEGCAAELAFGDSFIIHKNESAVLHIIVRTPSGDERGGSGFLISEPTIAIVTAKHVLEHNRLLRVERRDGTVLIGGADARLTLGPAGLDLAMIHGNLGEGLSAVPVEMRDLGAIDLEPVIVLGYPPIAGHEPSLIPVNAQATSGVHTFGRVRSSLVLQRITTPGFSGGPVLNMRGKAVGVVREEGGIDRGGAQSVFVLGTPTYYLRELIT